MTVYIEYVFLENFLFDGALLALALYAAKEKISWRNILFAAIFGGIFALIFPLLRLPHILAYLLKFSVGFLLSFIAFGKIETKNEWGRYAFTLLFFFIFSFAFGGVLTAFLQEFFPEKAPFGLVAALFALLCLLSLVLTKKLYQRKRLSAYIFECELAFGTKQITVRGFLDSGNTATKNALPVCFLSPLYIYELFGESLLNDGALEREETRIQTLNGEKKYPLYKGELAIKWDKEFSARQAVYFAPAPNMISREYEVLLQSSILERLGYGL